MLSKFCVRRAATGLHFKLKDEIKYKKYWPGVNRIYSVLVIMMMLIIQVALMKHAMLVVKVVVRGKWLTKVEKIIKSIIYWVVRLQNEIFNIMIHHVNT